MKKSVSHRQIAPLFIASLCVAALSACNSSDKPYQGAESSLPNQVAKPNIMVVNDNGSLILAESGLSLYTFDNDSNNTSTCEGTVDDTTTCVGKWPPLLAADGAQADTQMTLITRSDNTKQWAFKGMPLYHWHQDNAQGDIGGDGINDVWHLARPLPQKTSASNGTASYVGNQTIKTVTSTSSILTAARLDKEQYTLYTFDNDPIGDSACAGECINVWPPLLADAGAIATSPLSITTATNNNQQWAYKGKPLYFFKNDNQAGDINGDEVKDIWHIATQEPAIQRTTGNGRFLSATGQVNVLMSVAASVTEFTATMLDKDGFNLYVFDNDANETSNCAGQCLVNWPAFLASPEDVAIGDYTIFTRTDGNKQWAYDGKPLYFFKNDTTRGDINGDGVINLWHLIAPTVTTSP